MKNITSEAMKKISTPAVALGLLRRYDILEMFLPELHRVIIERRIVLERPFQETLE